jgi:hypothetical protein
MVTTVEAVRSRITAPIPRTVPRTPRRRVWLVAAVVCSRLIVLAAGSAGALFTRPLAWRMFDPTGISSGLGSVGNVLAASAVRWDAIGYITIAQHGYTTAGSTRWFPLYPLLMHVFAPAVGSPVIAGVLISLTAFGIGLTLVHRIASETLGSRAADATVLLLAFAPLSFVFSAVYTESLLLACAAGTFYLASRGRFRLACVVAACAALTHIQGILLVAPLAWMYWESRDRTLSLRRLWSPDLLALSLPPLALGGFFLYMHTQGWGWLAPITNQNVANAGRTLVGPPIVLFDSVKDVVLGLHHTFHGAAAAGTVLPSLYQNLTYLVWFTITILGLVIAWRRLPKGYALFAGLAILVCTSSAVTLDPMQGFGRYMMPIFPLCIGLAMWLERHRLTGAVVTISTVLLVVFTIEFTRWVSVF